MALGTSMGLVAKVSVMDAPIELRPLTDNNRAELEALRITPDQENFVSTVAASIAEGVEDVGGRAIAWGVYLDGRPVGFVMISDDVDGPEYIPHYLWKLIIDERYQRRGLGTAALDEVVAYFRSRTGVEAMWTSAGQGPGSPISFYEGYGFVDTGRIVFDNEVLLRLDLTGPATDR
jgi:diamine N-acetyltransferase